MDITYLAFEEYLHQQLSFRPSSLLLIINEEPSSELFQAVVGKALDEGAVSFMTWGLTADRYHDWIDEIIVWREMQHPEIITNPDDFVMTTGHDGESAEDVGFYLKYLSVNNHDNCCRLVLHHGPGPLVKDLQEWLVHCCLTEPE